jgi:opacity protein-like surface antigen
MSEVNASSWVSLNNLRFATVRASDSDSPREEKKKPGTLYGEIGVRAFVPYVSGMPEELRTVPYPDHPNVGYELNEGFVSNVADGSYWIGLTFLPLNNLSVYGKAGDFHRSTIYYSVGADYKLNDPYSIGYQFEQYSQGFRGGFTYRKRDDFIGQSYAILHVTPQIHELHAQRAWESGFFAGAGAQYMDVKFVHAYDWYDSERFMGIADNGRGFGLRLFGGWQMEPDTEGLRITASYTYGNLALSEHSGNVSYHTFQVGLSYAFRIIR